MRSMMARVGPTFGPQLAARPRMAGVVKLPTPAGDVQPAGEAGKSPNMAPQNRGFLGYTTGPLTLVLPTHMIVYRDYRGHTFSAAASQSRQAPVRDPRTGRKVPGLILGYVTVDGISVPPADVISVREFTEQEQRDAGLHAPRRLNNPGGLVAGDAQPAGEAGQPAGFSGNYDDYSGAEYDYSRDFTGGGPMTEEQYLASQEALGQVPGAPTQGMSDRVMGQLFTGIGTIIGGTITGVVDAIRSGNQVRIAEINAATAQYIADARARGNMEQAAAAQRLQAATSRENIQYIREPPPPAQTGMSTGTMVALGVGAVLVVGLGALLVLKRKRKNPVISDGSRRFFAQPDVAVKYLNDGFSVVGKTSSSRRRRRAAK